MKQINQKLNLSLIPNWLPTAIFVLALIGFSDAVYLTVEHYARVIPPCTIGGCESVLTSRYSNFFGTPVSLFGSLYYLLIMVFSILYFDTKKEIFLRIPFLASVIGFICSVWFMFTMIFIIKAFCPYCTVSAATSIIIFALSYYFVWKSLRSSPQVQG